MMRPPTTLFHAGDGGLSEEERTDDKEVEHAPVELFVIVLNGFLGLGRGGIWNNDIDRSQFVPGLFKEGFDFALLRNVGTDGDCFSSFGDDFIGNLLSERDGVVGVNDDFGSGGSEASGDSGPQTFAASGDEGDMSAKRLIFTHVG